MERYNFLAILLYTLIVTISCVTGDKEEAIKRGNKFVDKVLEDIAAEHGDEYDPHQLQDRIVAFHRKIVLVNISGEARLHNGFINGMSTLSRSGDCILVEKGNKLYVQAKLEVQNVEMFYSGTVKFINIGLTITVHGKVDHMEVSMKMNCNANDGRNGLLTQLSVDKIERMKVWITGLGPLNWALNVIISAVTAIFRGVLHHVVEKNIFVYVAVKARDHQFPVDDVDVDFTTTDDIKVTLPTAVEPFSESTSEPQDAEPQGAEIYPRRMKWNY